MLVSYQNSWNMKHTTYFVTQAVKDQTYFTEVFIQRELYLIYLRKWNWSPAFMNKASHLHMISHVFQKQFEKLLLQLETS